MGMNVAQKLISGHLVEGRMVPGEEIGIRVDQTLTQDATGTLVMLELEGMGLERVRTEVSVQYVDHNIIQTDHKNQEDHLFLQSACQRFGLWYSRPGNGVSHPVHMQYFGKPGKSLLGSDSHTPAGGSLGLLAIAAGGIDVALSMAGEPYHLKMPKIWGIKLVGELPDWVSAKDVILEMLRRHSVDGGIGYILEYFGSGLDHLSAMDRHSIGNMGAEMGATSSVFPSDEAVRRFLRAYDREQDWIELSADADAVYDRYEEIDLSELEPLIALPSSPGKVVPVREVAGDKIYQAYIGSSANPGYRDFAVAARMVAGRKVADEVSFDINPTSRESLEELIQTGMLTHLVHAGARLHQAGCNGCIGMGQAPAVGRNSLRTVTRNFPGRSGTREDRVFLCSPETVTASALKGVITDPRSLDFPYPRVESLEKGIVNRQMFTQPLPPEQARRVELLKSSNIVSLPEFDRLPDSLELPILLKVADHISTDEILPAGARVLPFRSNIPRISEFAFEPLDPTYASRAKAIGDHALVGGINYGQGSSREHAALAPRYLGLRLVLAVGFARIHRQNLVNFGVLPATFADPSVYQALEQGDVLSIENIPAQVMQGELTIQVRARRLVFKANLALTPHELEVLLAGGVINWIRTR